MPRPQWVGGTAPEPPPTLSQWASSVGPTSPIFPLPPPAGPRPHRGPPAAPTPVTSSVASSRSFRASSKSRQHHVGGSRQVGVVRGWVGVKPRARMCDTTGGPSPPQPPGHGHPPWPRGTEEAKAAAEPVAGHQDGATTRREEVEGDVEAGGSRVLPLSRTQAFINTKRGINKPLSDTVHLKQP